MELALHLTALTLRRWKLYILSRIPGPLCFASGLLYIYNALGDVIFHYLLSGQQGFKNRTGVQHEQQQVARRPLSS